MKKIFRIYIHLTKQLISQPHIYQLVFGIVHYYLEYFFTGIL